MHGNAPRCYLVSNLDPSAYAAGIGATLAAEIVMPATARRAIVDGVGLPVVAVHPHTRERRLGSMCWGMPSEGHVLGVHRLEGRGAAAEAYRRRRCAVVLSEYALDPEMKHERMWSGSPTMFAAVYEVERASDGSSRGCFALVAIDRTPVALTLEEADAWILRRENDAIDDAITIAKVDAILRRS